MRIVIEIDTNQQAQVTVPDQASQTLQQPAVVAADDAGAAKVNISPEIGSTLGANATFLQSQVDAISAGSAPEVAIT